MKRPLLVVLAGRPGTGKTTLASLLAAELHAGSIRTDAIATVVMGSGLTDQSERAGEIAYEVAHAMVAAMLQTGLPVVVDAVNATHARRAAWRRLAGKLDARLVVLEAQLPDLDEHRRRVESRKPDLPGQIVPDWVQVQAQPYDEWDDDRDGLRQWIDMSDLQRAVERARTHLEMCAGTHHPASPGAPLSG